MSKIAFVIICLSAGFVGGLLSNLVQVRFPTSQASSSPSTYSASSFNLVDSRGKIRAQLALSKEGPPALFLLDEQGRARGSFGLYHDGSAHLVLNDKNNQATHVMRSYGSDDSPLMIFKAKGRDEMIMGLNPSARAEPFMLYYDPARQRKFQFGKYDGP